jgi:calcium-dependent protein kinase
MDTLGHINFDAEYAALKAQVVSSALPAFSVGEKLGQGAFGTVFSGTTASGAAVAIKVIPHNHYQTSKQRYEALREARILRLACAGNPHVLHLVSCYEESRPHGDRLVIVTERAEGGELFDRITALSRYTERDAAKVALSMLGAVHACHTAGVIHRDLKPENILLRSALGEPGQDFILIADFGLSVMRNEITNPASTPVGTFAYMSPEIWTRREYTPAGDVWALGVLLYILLAGFPPFWISDDGSVPNMMDKICGGRYEFYDDAWSAISREAQDLISRLLCVDAAKRITLPEAMAHPWFTATHAASAAPLPGAQAKLKAYNAKRRFRSAALAVMFQSSAQRFRVKELRQALKGYELSADQVLAVTNTFNSAAGSGSAVDFASFSRVMTTLGLNFPEAVMNKLFTAIDRDWSGSIDHRELLAGLAALTKGDEVSLRLLFTIFDINCDGNINRTELLALLASTGFIGASETPSEADLTAVERIYEKMDANRDNAVTFDEFEAYVKADAALASCLMKPMRGLGKGAGAV